MSENPGPQPKRFEVYALTKDQKGFTIKGSSHVYRFNRQGGWHDQYGNYYNADGKPDDEPEQCSDDEYEHSDHDDFDDDYEREYGNPANYNDYDDEPPNVRKLETISKNLAALSLYPKNKKVRVYFENASYHTVEKSFYEAYAAKIKGIHNIIFDRNDKGLNGEGCFILDNVEAAEDLVKLQEEKVNLREVSFDVEDIQKFLLHPPTTKELESKFKLQQAKKQESKVEKQPQKSEKSEQKAVYLPKDKQQLKQQPKKEVKKQEWKSYKFNAKIFPKKSSFKIWMNENGLTEQRDYRNVEKMDNDHKMAKIEMKVTVHNAINGLKFEDKEPIFFEHL